MPSACAGTPLSVGLSSENCCAAGISSAAYDVGSKTVLETLYMYRGFQLLTSRHVVIGKRHGEVFCFDNDYWLVPNVRAVLVALDQSMPQWRASAERKKGAPIPRRHDRREGRRKPGRWKW